MRGILVGLGSRGQFWVEVCRRNEGVEIVGYVEPAEQRRAAKVALYEDLDAGRLSIAEAVKRMRQISGLTQRAFAERVAGLSTATLAQIERGEANPTVATLDDIGRAFGLEIGFRRRAPGELPPTRRRD